MKKIITSDRLQLECDAHSGAITKMTHLINQIDLARDPQQYVIIRTPQAISDPAVLTHIQLRKVDEKNITILFTADLEGYQAELCFASTPLGIECNLRAIAPQPIWLVEWKITGLQLDEILIPALGGQSIDKGMPADTVLSYKYPFWWNSQFVIGRLQKGGVWLYSRDIRPNLKLLRIGKDQIGFSLTYGYEASAPLKKRELKFSWYLDGFSGNWEGPADLHRQWMEESFDLKPLSKNKYFPEWARKINFVLELWGARKDKVVNLNTFQRMIERIEQWRQFHPPEKTLLYLPGFAENGIDSHAPDYRPSQLLGGEAAFKKFLTAAHRLGYKVMIHTNVLAMTFTHPHYGQFKKFQVIDPFERPQNWGLDIDGDWLAEPYFAYINPGHREWGDLMEKVLGDLVQKYEVDGIFLDQTLLAFNESRGPNFLQGMNDHVTRLQKTFPGVLFAGEGMHEYVTSCLPMAQIHGLDSILEVHGMEGQVGWRKVHPVSTYLFNKYVRFTAHLLTKHPLHPLLNLQEAAYSAIGVLPALCLYDYDQPIDTPMTGRMIDRANELEKSF